MSRLKNKEHAASDTIFFCKAIKKKSGLTHKAIEGELFTTKDAGKNSKFSRWLNGKQAMPPDTLQLALKKAIKLGWFRLKTGGIVSAQDQRMAAYSVIAGRAKEKIKAETTAASQFCKLNTAAISALTELLEKVKEVEHNLLFIDGLAGEHENFNFNFREVQDIANKLSQIGFIEMSPWSEAAS